MGDLLKEAIADAKAVRETALANAKAALEEAFTPKLQSMLSQKLKEEELEEGEHEDTDEEEDSDEGMREEDDTEEGRHDADEGEHEDADEGRGDSDEGHMDGHDDEDDSADDKDLDLDVGDDDDDDDDDMDEDLDLEAIIRELEEEDEEDSDEELEEVDKSSDIGKGDNKDSDTDKSSGIGSGDNKLSEEEDTDEEETVDEEIVDLSELLNDLTEEEDSDEEVEEVKAENVKLSNSLKEHRKVVKYLKDKLNEVNLLNAKLLYTNKLFKGYNLSNDQKLKIVETFDRAKNSREVKLVYSTLAESFAGKTGSAVTKINESKAIASKSTGSTKPKKVISEGNELADRFKKLAGII